MEPVWYFGYGSNMNRAIFCERRGMNPLAIRWGWLAGHRLCFDLPVGPGERGVANVVEDTGARTCGVLFLLDSTQLEHLDRTEGVHVGYYQRILVEVLAENGERIPAFTYRSTFSTPGRKPSARYLGLLVEGARQHGLPPHYVETLESLELAVDERLAKRSD